MSKRHPPPWFCLALSIACLASLPMSAANDPTEGPKPLSDLPLDQLLSIRADTVDAASRRSQPVSDAPSSVTIVDHDEIRKLGYTTLADILRQVRGFYVSGDRNYSYLGVRGFSRPGDYNSRVLFLVDGHRINDAVTESALIGNEFPIDVDLIERVEIVRGPSSAMYGSSALFGVVNVVTRSGANFNYGRAAFDAGSLDTYHGNFTLGHRWENEADLLVSGSWLDRGGQRGLYYADFDKPPASDGVARNLDRENRQNGFLKLGWKGLSLEAAHVDREKSLPTASYRTLFGAAGTRTDDQTHYVRAKLDETLDGGLQVMANVSYNATEYRGSYMYPQSVPGEPDMFPLVDGYRSLWLGEELLLRRTFAEQVTLTAGIEMRENLRQDQFSIEMRPPYGLQLDDHRHSLQAGPFAEAEWQLHPQLTLSAGGRFDHYEGRGSSGNPRLAAIWTPRDATHLKLLYGRAYRVPNAYELYYTDGYQTQKPSPGLRPERIATYEAVWEQEYGTHLKSTVAGFLYEAEDLITQAYDNHDDLLYYRNAARTRAAGIETELEARWESGLRGRLSHTFQQSADRETRQTLSNSPKHIVQGSLIVPLYREHLFAGLDARYLSSRLTGRGPTVGGVFVADVTLFAYRWAKGAELSASIYNVLDRRYSDPVGTELTQSSIAQDGRTFRLKLAYSF